MKRLTATFIVVSIILAVYGQEKKFFKKQAEIKLKKGDILFSDTRYIVAHKDTLVTLPITEDYYISKTTQIKADSIYKEIQEKAYKKRWTKELHNIVLMSGENGRQKDTVETQMSEIPFLPYRNLIIRKISLKKLDVFGPTINDREQKPATIIERAGNKIHYNSRDRIIMKHLLFKEGEAIDPYTFADNERILRSMPYIEDARIEIDDINESGDSADIIVVTKDVWSIGFDLQFNNYNTYTIDSWDKNILGSGQEFYLKHYNTPRQKPESGLNGYYRIDNILGTFINSQVGYNAYGSQGYQVDFWRDFFTQRTKYAGEFYLHNLDDYRKLKNDSGIYNYFPIHDREIRFWVGRAFPFKGFGIKSTRFNSIIISSGIYDYYYFNRPAITPKTRYILQNRTFYLSSIAFVNQAYYNSNLVYSFGRTEDIPYGIVVKLTSGIEDNQYYKRMYNSFTIANGDYIGKVGYLYTSLALGGYMNKGHFEQGILKANLNFFSNLMVIGSFRFRNFVNVDFVRGYSRYGDETLNLNNLSGIRGYENDSAVGTQKLAINLETVCFTPLYLAGFRFAAFAFADFGYVGPTRLPVTANPLYSGFGLGVRIRNERLVFKTFQIRFAYYPYLSHSARGELFTISDESRFKPANFYKKSPEIIPFQ